MKGEYTVKILAVDSSGLTATVAVYSDGVIVAAQSVNNKKTHSQTLLPMINDVMNCSGLKPDDIDAVAIAEGPGSFTGLRIGAATVKGLCLAINKPVIPVSTLAGLAYNLVGAAGVVCPVMDARRKQVYTALYSMENDVPDVIISPCAIGIEELVKELGEYGHITFVGDGIPVYKDYIIEHLGSSVHFAKPHLMLQNAASVAVLAAGMYEKGKFVEADAFEPVYFRLSQAEREKLERQQNQS